MVETNFKVYVQMPRENKNNYQLVRDLLNLLLTIDHESYNFQELIFGEITPQKMTDIFMQGIEVHEYLSFFLEYMSQGLSI